MKNKFKKSIASALAGVLALSPVLLMGQAKVEAAKLVDGTWTWTSGTTTTVVEFTTTGALAASSDIVLTFPSQATMAAGTNVTLTDDGTGVTATVSVTGQEATVVIDSGAITIAAGSVVSITSTDIVSAYTDTTYAQQSVGIRTRDSSDTAIDYGLGLITNDNATMSNKTDITADVTSTLTMAVDTNTIALGVLTTSAVSDVDQTYTLNTNNSTGLTASIVADGALLSGTDDIDAISAGGTVTANTEGYGIKVDAVGATTGTMTADATYSSNDNPLPTSADAIASSSGPVDAGVFDVNYRAAISSVTPAGHYTQEVTMTVVTNA